MNINIINVKWKNFLSYGNEFNEINIENGIDLVIGTNGVGKSSMIDALFFNLFGRPFRKVKTGSIINRINKKKLLTEVIFNVDSKKYKVIRGQKPAKFEIYLEVEDEYTLIEQRAATKDYQKFLEDEVLNLNETIFRQLVAVSSNLPSSKPFMELSQQEKESLFQVLTDTSIFGHLKTVLKSRISTKKNDAKDQEYRRDILKSSLDSEKIMIEQAEKQNDDFKKHHSDNINLTEENISTAKSDIEKYKNGLEKLKELKVKYDKKMTKISELQVELQETQEKDRLSSAEDRLNNEKTFNDNIFIIEETYNLINYDAEELKIQNLKDAILENTKTKMDLDLKIRVIESAQKDAIDCTSCKTVNYLIDITESEVQNKAKYKETIVDIMTDTNLKQAEIKKLEIALRLQKKDDNEKYNLKKKEAKEIKDATEAEILDELRNLSSNYTEFQSEISNLYMVTDGYKEKLLNGKRLKDTLTEKIDSLDFFENRLKELLSVKMVEIQYDSLDAKKADMKTLVKNIKTLAKDLDDLNYLETIIGGNNLKGAVIKKQIPFLNKGINHFLELFSMLEYSFVIDENFKERLINRDDDSEFNSLSNGQKARISFSIMFAFLKLIEERNGVKTNILVLDEILDSSVDASGREELLAILKSEFSDKKDIIIISHNEQIKEKIELFDRLIHIKKDKFSTVMVEEL